MDANNGPDQILQTEKIFTFDPDEPVRIRASSQNMKDIPPLSVPTLLNIAAKEYPNNIALAYKESDHWRHITFKQYKEYVELCAKAFIKLGLERHKSVCIIGFNSHQWLISNLAAIFAGGIAVGVYATNSPDACHYCAYRSRANIFVVENNVQLEKILAVKDKLPNLKAIVQYTGVPRHNSVLSWESLLKLGSQESDNELINRLKQIAINECCTIVFTSGTTGYPKAAMLTHDNLYWETRTVLDIIKAAKGNERVISYLPLSHIAGQIVDLYVGLVNASTTYFANNNILKERLINILQEIRPTLFFGVPRVWEKIAEKVMHITNESKGLKRLILQWSQQQAKQYHLNYMKVINSHSWGYYVARTLVLNTIKYKLGFSECKIFMSGAAPLAQEIHEFFLGMDIHLHQTYGMSETTGSHSISSHASLGLGSVGAALTHNRTKIFNTDKKQQGEICMDGRHIFAGYLGEEEKTTEAIDSDGWLHSGDTGFIDLKGNIYITGRIKEIIITAGGENIPPTNIESLLLRELPCLSHAIVIGDQKKFLSVLLTLKTDIDLDTGAPLDSLTSSVKEWLRQLDCKATTVTEVLAAGPHSNLIAAIQRGIDNINKQAISNAQKVQKFAILPADFSLLTGELGPTMKMKRNVIQRKYTHIIDLFYTY